MKKIAILQSNYIPWKGYFDLIAYVDEFIIYDDMQYTRRDWRNRNKIKTPQGLVWLTVPVKVKGHFLQKIRETEIDGTDWARKHFKSLTQHYAKAPYFTEIASLLEPLYQNPSPLLSTLNRTFIDAICAYLGIKTRITNSWEYQLISGKTERLVDLCLQAGGDIYISGGAAKDYIKPELFAQKNIQLNWFTYDNYPEYKQLWGSFVHQVSILDLLFNMGPNSSKYMRFVR